MNLFNKISTTFLIVFSICSLYSCSGNNESSNELETATLQLSWIPELGSAGEINGSMLFDSVNNLELKVIPGGSAVNPITTVVSGSSAFGIVSSDKILIANEKGADLVIIGTLNFNHPGVFLSKKEDSIVTLNDWKDKNIGVLPAGDMEYLYRALLEINDLKPAEDFREVPASFGIQTFVDDNYDVRPAFINDETVTLDQRNIEYNIIYPKDYGVSFRGKSYFCRRETVEANPELVQRFINTVAKGWEHVLDNPVEGINNLYEFDNTIEINDEIAGLKKDPSYFQGKDGKVLYCDMESWDEMVEQLKRLELVGNINHSNYINNSFINKYHGK